MILTVFYFYFGLGKVSIFVCFHEFLPHLIKAYNCTFKFLGRYTHSSGDLILCFFPFHTDVYIFSVFSTYMHDVYLIYFHLCAVEFMGNSFTHDLIDFLLVFTFQ